MNIFGHGGPCTAILLATLVATPATAEPVPARCMVNLVGKGSYDGPCMLDSGCGGSFEAEATGPKPLPGGARKVRVAVFSPRQAMVSAIAPGGAETKWGAARQASTGCWLGMTQSICVYDAAGASLLAVALATPQAASPKTWTVTGRLVGLDIGDNVWLEWTDTRNRPQNGLCSAAACEPWFRAGRLPGALVGRPVRLTLRVGKAMSGDVMVAEAEEVIGIAFVDQQPAQQKGKAK